MMDYRRIIDGYLKADGKCYGHCDQKTDMYFMEDGENLISCMTCPGGYVSRIVMYGRDIDVPGFKKFLSANTAGLGAVADQDIRIATRHPWDLGLEGKVQEDIVLREAYWTQNYRRTKSDDPSRKGLFLCRECGKLLVSPVNEGLRSHSVHSVGGSK